MKNRSLNEDVKRIRTLLYGKGLINEQQKVDEPQKADYITDNVDEFFKTLDSVSKTGLNQQSYGSMTYQKGVEAMQVGLMMLGYSLPQHGVDGMFGPETAQAVQKFQTDNNINASPSTTPGKPVTESVRMIKLSLLEAALDSPLDSTSINSPFGTRWGGQGHNGVDLKADASNVKAPADGVVEVGEIKNDACGGTIIINHAGGFKTGFCHMQKINVTAGQQIKQGDIIGISGGGSNDIGHGKSDGRHLHFTLRKDGQLVNPMDYIDKSGIVMTGGVKGSPQVSNISATPEMFVKLIELLKSKNIKPEELKKYVDSAKRGNNYNVDVKDWQGMVNLVINNLEGGYYHPDMLQDGRVKDSRYGNSGETMFGLDRMAGGTEATGPAGKEFWALIDSQNARTNWKYGYMANDNPGLESKLRVLAGNIMKPLYGEYVHKFLSPEAAQIVNSYAPLAFNFIYGTWNGPGWFQKFAKVINDAVAGGNTDPKSLLQISLERRSGSGNSLIAQGGPKVANISNNIAASTSTMA
jgi:hypothetical protein